MTRPDVGVLPLPGRRAPDWVDAALAVLAAVLAVTVLVGADVDAIDPALHPPSALAVVLTAVGAAGTGLRRKRPLLGLAVVAVAAIVVSGGGYFTGVLPYLTMVALYSVAAYGTRREAVIGLVLIVASFVALQGAGVPDLAVIDVVTSVALCVAVVAVGDAVRQRRAHQRDLLAAAGARAEAASRQAVVEERLRIARELHDVVAHSMSLIAVQAGVGAHLLRGDPDAAERALVVIAETSRHALVQTRSVVGLLRGGEDAQSPVPGLMSLEALVRGVREAGLHVDVRVDGTSREVPALVDLAAYRVVQEALTNAVKHAPDHPVTVRISYAPTALRVVVGATGSGERADVAPAGTGFGLMGLQERARAVGGSFTAGATPDGGFQVCADLPTGEDAP